MSWKGQCLNGVWKERLYLAFKNAFLQLSASSVVPLFWPTPPSPTQDSVPTGDSAKANSSEEVALSFQCGRKRGMDVRSRPCGTWEAVRCARRRLSCLCGRAMSVMWWWVKPVRLLSCEVSVIFSQQVPCGVWECLFSGSIMSTVHSLPGAENLRVEIVPDILCQGKKKAVTSVITESDYTRASSSWNTYWPRPRQVRGRVICWALRRSGLKDLTYSSKTKH